MPKNMWHWVVRLWLCWCLPLAALAHTFRFAAQDDVQSADPHGANHALTQIFNMAIHERLVERDGQGVLVGRIATRWEQLTPTRWRFYLRQGVVFHDGKPLTAHDVAFSLVRSQHPRARLRHFAQPVGEAQVIDSHTIDFVQIQPNPILLEQLTAVYIMSADWARAHRAEFPPDSASLQSVYSSFHANGSGPWILTERVPDTRTVLRRNPAWWGWAEGLAGGNVETVVFHPMAQDASRVQALLAGSVDMVWDPPPPVLPRLAREPQLRVLTGPEQRIVYLGMDQAQAHLGEGGSRRPNPFADLRVRQAVSLLIDRQALQQTTLREFATPTGGLVPAVGYASEILEAAPAFDLARARQLLVESGHSSGIDVDLDCPISRALNDVCTALAGMLSKGGIRVRVNNLPQPLFGERLRQRTSRFFAMSWGGSTADPQPFMQATMFTPDQIAGWGGSNFGGFSNPRLDQLLTLAASEMRPTQRLSLLHAAQTEARQQLHHIPLYRPMTSWAMDRRVLVPHRRDNLVEFGQITLRKD